MSLTADIKRQGYAADGDTRLVRDSDSSLVPSRKVLERYLICDRTLDRWTAKPTLGFPQPVLINKRRYWRVAELAAWERSRAKGVAA